MLSAVDFSRRIKKQPVQRIVIYHDLDNHSIKGFAKHIDYYSKNYKIVPLTQFIEFLDSGQDSPDKVICLTFDDAYKSLYDKVAPILDKYGIKPCIFVPVGFIEAQDKPKYIKENLKTKINGDSMTWDQLRILAERGYEIGAHSWNHIDFGKNDIDYEYEMKSSKDKLQKMLGVDIKHFAFPFGGERNFTRQAVEKAKDYEYSRCFSGIRRKPAKGKYLLPRTYINPFWGKKAVQYVLAGCFDKKERITYE